METENRFKLLALLSLLCTLALAINSSMLTARLFYSLSTDTLQSYMLMTAGLALDCGKILFIMAAGYKLKFGNYVPVLGYVAMGLVCITISYYASMAWDLNTNNLIKNLTVTSDVRFKAQGTVFNNANLSIADLRKSITSLRSSKDAEIKNSGSLYNSQISNARKLDMITTPRIGVNALTEKKRKAEASTRYRIDAEIKQKESLLLNKEKGLTSINDGFGNLTSNIGTTQGLGALAKHFNPKDPEKGLADLLFYKNVVMELAPIMFAFAFGLFAALAGGSFPENVSGGFRNVKNKLKGMFKKPTVVTGFHQEPEKVEKTNKETITPLPSLDSDIIKAYAKEAVNSYRHEDSSVGGLTTMSNRTGYSRTELTEAHTVLKHNSYIRTEGNTTYVDSIDKLKSLL